MPEASWEDALYAFSSARLDCEAGRWSKAREGLAAALRHSGREVGALTPTTDAELQDRPPHWLLVMGHDGGHAPYGVFAIPTSAIDETMRAALARCDGQSCSTAEVESVEPELWRSWVRLALATGVNDYDDFATVLDEGDEDRAVDEATRESVAGRWEEFDLGYAATLPEGALDRRFVGATFFHERL